METRRQMFEEGGGKGMDRKRSNSGPFRDVVKTNWC